MKKFIYGFFGETAGRLIIVSWNWLWGISEASEQEKEPIDPDPTHMKEIIREMQNSVDNLTQAVAVQVNNYQQVEERYSAKVQEVKDLETKAKILKAQGNTEAARLTLIQAINLEKILPRLKEAVESTEKHVNVAKEELMWQKEKLEIYKSEWANLQVIHNLNQILEQVVEANNDYNIDLAKSQFEATKKAVNERKDELQAISKLSKTSTETLEEKIDSMGSDDEVSRRLEKLGNEESSPKK